jgi:hypothetical protein
MDIVASCEDTTGGINIEFVTECRVSKKSPWSLFSSQHTHEGFNRLFGYCINSESARGKLIEKGIETIMRLPWMKKSWAPLPNHTLNMTPEELAEGL